MKILQIIILAFLIICLQLKQLDSSLIIQNGKPIPEQFISSCQNQLLPQYYDHEKDNLQQIKEQVLKNFKTNPKQFILKFLLSTHDDQQRNEFQLLQSSLILQFKQYLFHMMPLLIIFIAILVYWAYCIFKRKSQKENIPSLQENKYLRKILLAILIVVSILGALLMIYGIYQRNQVKIASTILCKVGSIDVDQPKKDIQQYVKGYTDIWDKLKQLVNKTNLNNSLETISYSNKLLKSVKEATNPDKKLVDQLKRATELLQGLYMALKTNYLENIHFVGSLDLISSKIIHFQSDYECLYQSFDQQMPINNTPSYISFYCNIFYLLVISAFVYAAIISILVYFKKRIITRKDSLIILYSLSLIFMISISIAIVTAIVTPSTVLWNKSLQTVRHENDISYDFTILEDKKIQQYEGLLDFFKIMFHKNYNVQNITNGALYRSFIGLNKSFQSFQNIKDDYFIQLFKNAESIIEPAKLSTFANLDSIRKLQFDLQYTKWLKKSIKKNSATINSILQKQFFSKPSISLRQSKITNFNMLNNAQDVVIIESQRAHNLFKKICIIALMALICQIIIEKQFIKEEQSNMTIEQNNGQIKEKKNQFQVQRLQADSQISVNEPQDKLQ